MILSPWYAVPEGQKNLPCWAPWLPKDLIKYEFHCSVISESYGFQRHLLQFHLFHLLLPPKDISIFVLQKITQVWTVWVWLEPQKGCHGYYMFSIDLHWCTACSCFFGKVFDLVSTIFVILNLHFSCAVIALTITDFQCDTVIIIITRLAFLFPCCHNKLRFKSNNCLTDSFSISSRLLCCCLPFF